MKRWDALTIVTSCRGYGKYLKEWSASIAAQTVRPGAVRIFTHGNPSDEIIARDVAAHLRKLRIDAAHIHSRETLDLGVARNRAIAMAETEWVMHFDADDTLMTDGIEACFAASEGADVVQAGYRRSGHIGQGPTRNARLYDGADGLAALDLPAICSGNSPFKKELWTQEPYREDMLGAWDTALWIGFARHGARFRPSKKPVFFYRMHADSVFNKRKRTNGWARHHTSAMLKALRRNYRGVDIIVPISRQMPLERDLAWKRVRAHYKHFHPEWNIIEAVCPTAEWSKGRAIADGLEQSKAEVIVVADADVIVSPTTLRLCVQAVKEGSPWAQPHRTVYRANAALTKVILNQSADQLPPIPAAVQCDRPPHESAPGGGIFVMKRVNYDAIGGIPQSFKGWGSEDKALALLADTLIGLCDRAPMELVHLYHPHQQVKVQPQNNVGLLAKMGHAALHGKDSLVSLTSSLPNIASRPSSISPTPGLKRQAVREVKQFDQKAIAERRQRLQERRRRMP